MADIVINLGDITVKDNAPGSGKLTQQNYWDWLDQQRDQEGAGSLYQQRLRKALRQIGKNNVQERVSSFVHSQAIQAIHRIEEAAE